MCPVVALPRPVPRPWPPSPPPRALEVRRGGSRPAMELLVVMKPEPLRGNAASAGTPRAAAMGTPRAPPLPCHSTLCPAPSPPFTAAAASSEGTSAVDLARLPSSPLPRSRSSSSETGSCRGGAGGRAEGAGGGPRCARADFFNVAAGSGAGNALAFVVASLGRGGWCGGVSGRRSR
uniref:Uncharacterized protein n=1 Tax=Arundo donax TaxID=35708 RepID=A0A0A9HDK2_ARUDO